MRLAKISPANNNTGNRLMVAVAAPVTIFVAPGPIDDEQAKVPNRFFIFA